MKKHVLIIGAGGDVAVDTGEVPLSTPVAENITFHPSKLSREVVKLRQSWPSCRSSTRPLIVPRDPVSAFAQASGAWPAAAMSAADTALRIVA